MPITKSRGTTEKLGPISVGNKIIRFKIPHSDRRFTVHEDLICRTSRFFKDRLQKYRKPILSIDECYVCAEALNATVKDITFCVKCGQNVHEVCIEAWKRSSATGINKESAPTCPMCRASWKNHPLSNHLDMEFELDADAVQIYLDWLYTSTLNIAPKTSCWDDDINLNVLKLWAVSNAVKDPVFKAEVITMYVSEPYQQHVWADSVNWAFVECKCDDEIRDFIIDMFLTTIEPGWFKDRSRFWPAGFVSRLADVAMVRWRDRKDAKTLKKMWMKKLGVGMELVSDDESIFPLSGNNGPSFAAPTVQCDNHRATELNCTISGPARRPSNRRLSGQKVEVRNHAEAMERRSKRNARISFFSDDSDDDEPLVTRSRV